jgi:DNA mismatch endonuclease, patch repair protein
MADVFSKEQRSQIMRQVKANFNKSTELRLIRFFKINFITGWRRNYKIYGKPDFVFPKERLTVFVDGCFWHGHTCRNTKPKDNKNYWDNKIKKNIERDISVTNILESKGWKVLRIWECQLKDSELLINLFHF